MADKNNLYKTDPDFMKRYEAFALKEAVTEEGQELDDETRYMAILASLLACQGSAQFKITLDKALEGALTPIQVKEIVYQSVAYLGMGKVYPFLEATNEVMMAKGIDLPLESQETTSMDDRREKGTDAQVAIFGEGMKEFWKGGHINRWLAANCFGDYYTRKGLSLKQRELVTFCYLSAQGGCESQLMSHIFGNLNLGNDKALLIKIVSQCLPYIGYPRSLNALNAINQATEKK